MPLMLTENVFSDSFLLPLGVHPVPWSINGVAAFWLACGFILVLAFVAVYDAAAVLAVPARPTVSEIMHQLSAKYPILPFFAGLVAGHLWF